MRKILTIVTTLVMMQAAAQKILINPPSGVRNTITHYADALGADSILFVPISNGKPAINMAPYRSAYPKAAIMYDVTGQKWWGWSPILNDWMEIGGGGVSTEADPLSVHITDSAAMLLPYARKNEITAYQAKVVTTVAGLATLTAIPPDAAIVTDTLRGGSFVAVTSAAAPDNGITFASASPGVLWQRNTTQTAWVNVRWFGAKGDKTAVDGPAVQAANDYLWKIGGGTVFFPPNKAGEYYRLQRPIYRRDNVGWEGIQDASVVYNDTVVNKSKFGGNAVCVYGDYQPTAWDDAQYYDFNMDTVFNTIHIIDSFSRFKRGDIVIITGTSSWANAKGYLKPYVTRINEVDSTIAPDKIVLKYSLDTLLLNGKIAINGHFIPGSDKALDSWGNPTYMTKNVSTKNLVIRSEGQWNIGMACLNCSFENLNITAAELFSVNGFAWGRVKNIYGTCWKQVTELAIGTHNSIIDGVQVTFSNSQNLMKSKGRQPIIKFGENVFMNTLRNYVVNANNCVGRGIWFGAATWNKCENITIYGKKMTNDIVEFSNIDWALNDDDPSSDSATFVSSFVNNNRVENSRFITGNINMPADALDNQISQYVYFLKAPAINARLENNRLDNCIFVGPVSPIHAIILDGDNTYLNNCTLEKGIVAYGPNSTTSKLWNCFINGQSVFVQNAVAFDIFKDTRPQVDISIADDTTIAATPIVSSLSIPALANMIYKVSYNLKTSCSGTGGIFFTLNGPAGASFKVGQIAGSGTGANNATTMRMSGLGSETSPSMNRFAGSGNAAIVAEMTTGATPGNIFLSFRSGTAGETTKITSGSVMELQEQVFPPAPAVFEQPPNLPFPYPFPFPFPFKKPFR